VKVLGAFLALVSAGLGGHTPTPTQEKVVWIARPLPDAEQVRRACPKTAPSLPVMEAHLRRDGTVDDVRIVRAGGCRAVERLISKYIRGWKFKPAPGQQDMWLTLSVFIHGS